MMDSTYLLSDPRSQEDGLFASDGSIRCIFYARYSSDNQSDSSIDDQFRNCHSVARRKGWVVLEHLNQSDEEKTGRTQFGKPGLKALMEIAKASPRVIDYIVIDDTSRFGRNAAETMQLAKILRFHGVSLFFVEDSLDSQESSFWDNFTQKAIEDERFSRRLGHKVQRGQVGHFNDGYNPGGSCYGYVNVPEFDPTKKGLYGQPGVRGVNQAIDPETAAVVRRIFVMYAEGASFRDIALQLNKEGVPTSRGPKSKRKPLWSKHAIQTILINTRYIGKLTWGKTKEDFDPETGRRKRRSNPKSEWHFREAPELRIVPDELWERVQKRREAKAVNLGVRRCGGMNRTEASRRYLLSGLMKCGVCGANILVTCTSPARYGCSSHRNRGGCSNKATILQTELEQAFVAALSENLRAAGSRDELALTLFEHLENAQKQQAEEEGQAGSRRAEMESTRAKHIRHKRNLVDAIKEGCGSRSIYAELEEIEGKIERLDEILEAPISQPSSRITLEEVRDFLSKEVGHFKEMLLGNPEKVRAEFQRRIENIILTPVYGERGVAYKVTGDVELFSAPGSSMQTHQVHLMGLHYKIPIEFEATCYKLRMKWTEQAAA